MRGKSQSTLHGTASWSLRCSWSLLHQPHPLPHTSLMCRSFWSNMDLCEESGICAFLRGVTSFIADQRAEQWEFYLALSANRNWLVTKKKYNRFWTHRRSWIIFVVASAYQTSGIRPYSTRRWWHRINLSSFAYMPLKIVRNQVWTSLYVATFSVV